MWVVRNNRLLPIQPFEVKGQPYHSNQLQALPRTYEQNSSLEMAWTRVAEDGTIAGEVIVPFYTQGHEGFDIHTREDIDKALFLISRGQAHLPALPERYKATEYTP